ncbi:very short patch repair endonuclease [Bradyrhizobium sp. I71]|uniref:very short patch repair endonuclease n=1 Tax=Bradyrhizobium sp. I71 TaxID=2590772 RepID=UPI001EF97B33|nr:very short patch repair endonuclease [Bradyrhizobium sp. I71]ULL01232.1 DNA mismatch endonuclease Vsr [Bradyrhizobium sp. I71]
MDTRTPEQRRMIMQSVGAKNTGPEMVVRKLLHRAGYRYRLHSARLPGKPDIVFPVRRKVIFVHGCFWHGHDCPKGRLPKSRTDFWQAKLDRNKERDTSAIEQLELLGWTPCVIWQCETKDAVPLLRRLKFFLEG